MNSSVLAALLVPVLLVPWSQEGTKPQEQKPAKVPWSLGDAGSLERLRTEILGPWQLVNMVSRGVNLPNGHAAGFALFVDGYMSIEVHMQALELEELSNGRIFQSGTRRWQFNDLSQLEMSSLIGTTNDTPELIFEFEKPGTRRLFIANLANDELTLEPAGEQGQTRLTFHRLGQLPYPNSEEDVRFPDAAGTKPKTGKRP